MKAYAQGKISLTKVFSESMHLPTRKEDTGKYPLYPHKIGSEVGKRTIRSAGWQKASRDNFNSPSNIRLVCLDQYSSYVSYWNTPIVNGRKKDLGIPLHEMYTDVNQSVLLDPSRLYSDNAGLGCLVRDYVCPNIEELWITAEAFGIAGNRNPAYAALYQKLRMLNPGQVVSVSEIADFLAQEIKRDVRTTFPLLRCIVVVVKPPSHLQRCFQGYAKRTQTVSTYLNETYPDQRLSVGEVPAIMQDIANASGFGYAVCVLPGADMLKFSLGDYKYDEDFLTKVKSIAVNKYSEKEKPNEDVVDASVEEKVARKEAPPEPTSLLQIIDELERAGYSKASINTALFAYRSIDIKYIKEQVERLPSAVIEKYAGSLGGELTGNKLEDTKNRKTRIMALARLSVEPPTEHLHSMVMSAYKDSIFELDTDYIDRYKSVYYALFDIATVAVIQSRLAHDGYTSGSRIQKIREYTNGGSSADIVPLIAAMQFSMNCGNPSGFTDFDTKDDTDLTFDPKHIIEQCVASVLKSFEVLYSDVYIPSKAPKGTYSRTIPGYPDGILCHNTAHNLGRKGTKGNDSLLRLKGPTGDCVRSFYSKTLCNAVLTTDKVKNQRLCIESGAVRAELLGAGQTLYFPRQAGRFASGTVLGKQVRYDDRASFMSAVRKWLNNRLLPVYTYYSRKGDVWETAEAVKRAANSLSKAFIVTEYEEDGVRMLRIRSNMFVVGTDDLKDLSADTYTVMDVTQTKTEDFRICTITVALKGGLLNEDVDIQALVKAEEKESQRQILALERELAQKAIDANADLIYAEVANVLKSKGFRVSGLECTQSPNSRAFGLDKTTHRFEVEFGGEASSLQVENRTYTDASDEDIAKALDLLRYI